MNKRKLYSLGAAILVIPTLIWFAFKSSDTEYLAEENNEIHKVVLPEPVVDYGLTLDSFEIVEGVVRPSQFLSNILLEFNVEYPKIHALSLFPDSVFNEKRIAAGKKYLILSGKNEPGKALYFIYRSNEIEYVVCDLRDTVKVYKGQKEVERRLTSIAGKIHTSLYDALTAADGDPMLSLHMANILAWSIDFYRLQKGDWFKVIYEEEFVDGKSIGIGKIEALDFNHEGRDFYGFYYKQDSMVDYFDEEANSLRKAFLKSPLKFSRLTSGFTRRRFHPVQKRWKAHLGTDYAAPSGTPILATGDGKVIEARYKRYNGNYVKIRHNGTYTTQYLHMSKIAKGMVPGKFVHQGDVIGYVGSTGLATGPHVCYRFWKFGEQVNHLQEDFPPSEPVDSANLEEFKNVVQRWKKSLDEIQFKQPEKSLAFR